MCFYICEYLCISTQKNNHWKITVFWRNNAQTSSPSDLALNVAFFVFCLLAIYFPQSPPGLPAGAIQWDKRSGHQSGGSGRASLSVFHLTRGARRPKWQDLHRKPDIRGNSDTSGPFSLRMWNSSFSHLITIWDYANQVIVRSVWNWLICHDCELFLDYLLYKVPSLICFHIIWFHTTDNLPFLNIVWPNDWSWQPFSHWLLLVRKYFETTSITT